MTKIREMWEDGDGETEKTEGGGEMVEMEETGLSKFPKTTLQNRRSDDEYAMLFFPRNSEIWTILREEFDEMRAMEEMEGGEKRWR